MISVRRGQCAVEIIFCTHNDNFDVVLYMPWDTDFTVQSQNEAYKNSAKIIQKFSQTR